MNKWVLIIGAFILVIVLGFYARSQGKTTSPTQSQITSFVECVAAGNPVMESYPSQCSANGQTFVQDIGNELEHSGLIQVNNPRPNQLITNPLTITGQARGQWYFEATFPFELLDANGVSLGTGFATAEGEWMTEEFVPFTGELTFTLPTTPTGQLVIKNSNPSGLPENEKTLTIPVLFQE